MNEGTSVFIKFLRETWPFSGAMVVIIIISGVSAYHGGIQWVWGQ